MKYRILTIMVSVFAALMLAGCAAPEPAQEAEAAPQRVEVVLTEFAVESSITEFEVGQTYEFVITNKGAIEHELRIIPPAAEGEVSDHGDDEHSAALLVVEAADLGPNETATVSYTFDEHDAETSLEFACHIAGHYEADMRLPITLD